MGRPKKEIKAKAPIRLRERKLANGNRGLYLDVYSKGVRRYESLGLYLIPEIDANAKAANKATMKVAEKIKADRILALQKRGIRQYDKVKRSSMSFLNFLEQYENEDFGFTESTLKGRREMRKKVEQYMKKNKLSDIAVSELDADFVKGFIRFLDTSENALCTTEKTKGRIISKGCAHHHQAVLNGALNKAVREGLLTSNPMKELERHEKFHPSPAEREYLTIEELRRVMRTPCPSNEEVKKAFIFACFAGLRLSDIRELSWAKIKTSSDGESQYVSLIMKKTQMPVNVPLSDEALKCLRKTGSLEERIFQLPASDATINYDVKKWMKSAGIEKPISFHCSRHTFATMMLTLGADIYTTSKLLGHTNVNTTQIYGKIVDKKKVDAVNMVSNLFGND